MVSLVTAATWLGSLLAGNQGMWLGYLTGHALVSTLWMVLAAWILLAAKGVSARASLGAGVVLAVAGVIKLIFFDLGTLEGLPRAMAFLVSGVALLTIAALRTRRTRSAEESRGPDPEEQQGRQREQQSGEKAAGGTPGVEGDVAP